MADMAAINSILRHSKNSGHAVRELYLYYKATDPKYSLSYFCRKASIPSSGYLSQVMLGGRTLSLKYARPLAEAFKLESLAFDFFLQLVAVDILKPSVEKTRQLESLALARKTLGIEFREMAPMYDQKYFNFIVFCAFGLFSGTPTARELGDLFTDQSADSVDRALESLQSLGWIRREGEKYHLNACQIVFEEGHDAAAGQAFIQYSLTQAASALPHWFNQKNLAHFESSFISVRKRDYMPVLARLKKDLLSIQAELESEDADTIIHFNFQIFPTLSKDHFRNLNK